MTPEQQQMLAELKALLSHHNLWSTADFAILQTLLWASILSSTAATLLTATGKGAKWFVALLAVIPAFALTVESTLNFSERYQFHDKYMVALEDIKYGLEIRKDITAARASEMLVEFRRNGPQIPPPRLNLRESETKTKPPGTSASQPGQAR